MVNQISRRIIVSSVCNQLCFISGKDEESPVGGRFTGFMEAMDRYNIEVNDHYTRLGNWRLKSGYEIIKQMIDSGVYPEAVVAGNDILAMGILQGIKEKGLSVPEDIAVIGFDDIPYASWPAINLSTIRQPKSRMGKSAVEILLDQFQTENRGGTVLKATKIILDPELILRGTC